MARPAQHIPGALLLALSLGGSPLWAAEHVVSQKNKEFSTATLTVKAGEKVVFKNQDTITHNVFTISKGMAFHLSIQPPGKSATYTFANPGVAAVQCAFHPKMKLTVTVTK
jgi:plastocyanin